jgi:hypothetical protein
MRLPTSLFVLLTSALLGMTACAGGDDERAGTGDLDVLLGPTEGRDLPPADLERVSVGDRAPDFRLASLRRGVVALSDYLGEKDVVLVFYRGHW